MQPRLFEEKELSSEYTTRLEFVRELAEQVEYVLLRLTGTTDVAPIDMRWLGIAQTNLQQGFMALERAIIQPEKF